MGESENSYTNGSGKPKPRIAVPDFSKSRRDQKFDGMSVIRKSLSVKVGKPDPDDYWRAHPDEDFHQTHLIYKPTRLSSVYLVDGALEGLLHKVTYEATLYAWITLEGKLGLWDVRAASSSFGGNDWTESTISVIEKGFTYWVRYQKNDNEDAWEANVAEDDWGEPQWPEGKTMDDFLHAAFDKRFIDSEDHPIVQRIFGRRSL
jgi:hypothetical protein